MVFAFDRFTRKEIMMASYRDIWLMEIGNIQKEMERFLNHYAGAKPPSVQFAKRAWEPAVDVYETTNSIVIAVDLAGVAEDCLEIIGNRTTFVIRGERTSPGTGIQRSYHQMEIISGPFERVISLPVAVGVEQAKARYRAGILQISVPKSRRKTPAQAYVRIVRGRRANDGR